MHMHTRVSRVYRFIVSSEGLFVESAQNLTPEKYQGGREAWRVRVTHPFNQLMTTL